MRKAKFISTIILTIALLGVGSFGIYALVKNPYSTNNNISFEVVDGAMFETKINYGWTDTEIIFGISKDTGKPNEEEVESIEGENSYQTIKTPPDLKFKDTLTEYETQYEIKNTGESTLFVVVNGFCYDSVQDQRYTTKVSFGELTNVYISANMVAQEGIELEITTFSISLSIEPNETETIKIVYKLERMNSTFEVEEKINFKFSI